MSKGTTVTAKLRLDPWRTFTLPSLPDDAPREQVMEYAALRGCLANYDSFGLIKRVIRVYCERWYPDLELPV